jgi:hypothetical protein
MNPVDRPEILLLLLKTILPRAAAAPGAPAGRISSSITVLNSGRNRCNGIESKHLGAADSLHRQNRICQIGTST